MNAGSNPAVTSSCGNELVPLTARGSAARRGHPGLRPRLLARAVTFACALGVGSCIPEQAAHLTVPMTSIDGAAHARALVIVPLDQLAIRMDPFDADALAFYVRGREPAPHVLLDNDGDGLPDHAALRIPVTAGVDHLVVICPGPSSGGEPAQVPPGAFSEVILDFAFARR